MGAGDFLVGGVKRLDECAVRRTSGRIAITLLAGGSPGGLLMNKKTGQTAADRKLLSSVRREMNEPRLAQSVLDQATDQATSTVRKPVLLSKSRSTLGAGKRIKA